MCKHAVDRDMGDGQRLSDKQVIQHWIAESRADIDAARYYVLHTALMIEQQGAKEARHHISAIKFFCSQYPAPSSGPSDTSAWGIGCYR